MPDLQWPIEAMRRGPAQAVVVVVAAAAGVVEEEPAIMLVGTATVTTGPAGDIAPKHMWHSCRKTARRPADSVAPTAPTAMPTARFGPATATAPKPT